MSFSFCEDEAFEVKKLDQNDTSFDSYKTSTTKKITEQHCIDKIKMIMADIQNFQETCTNLSETINPQYMQIFYIKKELILYHKSHMKKLYLFYLCFLNLERMLLIQKNANQLRAIREHSFNRTRTWSSDVSKRPSSISHLLLSRSSSTIRNRNKRPTHSVDDDNDNDEVFYSKKIQINQLTAILKVTKILNSLELVIHFQVIYYSIWKDTLEKEKFNLLDFDIGHLALDIFENNSDLYEQSEMEIATKLNSKSSFESIELEIKSEFSVSSNNCSRSKKRSLRRQESEIASSSSRDSSISKVWNSLKAKNTRRRSTQEPCKLLVQSSTIAVDIEKITSMSAKRNIDCSTCITNYRRMLKSKGIELDFSEQHLYDFKSYQGMFVQRSTRVTLIIERLIKNLLKLDDDEFRKQAVNLKLLLKILQTNVELMNDRRVSVVSSLRKMRNEILKVDKFCSSSSKTKSISSLLNTSLSTTRLFVRNTIIRPSLKISRRISKFKPRKSLLQSTGKDNFQSDVCNFSGKSESSHQYSTSCVDTSCNMTEPYEEELPLSDFDEDDSKPSINSEISEW